MKETKQSNLLGHGFIANQINRKNRIKNNQINFNCQKFSQKHAQIP